MTEGRTVTEGDDGGKDGDRGTAMTEGRTVTEGDDVIPDLIGDPYEDKF